MKKTIQPRLLALALFSPFAASAATLFSDTFSSDSLSNYTLVGGSNITYGATAGVAGGGGLIIGQAANNSTTLIPAASSFTFGAGASNETTVSMFLKLNAGGFGGGTSKAFVGIADAASYGWGSNAPAGVSALGGGQQNAVQLITRSAITGGGSFNANNQSTISLTGGNWYQFTTVLTKPASGGIWLVDVSIQDFGSNGVTPGSILSSATDLSVDMGASSISGLLATNLAAFGIRDQSWSAMDNFSVTTAAIPEPSAFAAIGGGIALLGALSSRRRRAGG